MDHVVDRLSQGKTMRDPQVTVMPMLMIVGIMVVVMMMMIMRRKTLNPKP